MNRELIDRNEIKGFYCWYGPDVCEDKPHDCDHCENWTVDKKTIFEVPTVDVVPVEKLRLAMEKIKYKSTTETKCEGMGMPFVRVKMIETNLALDILQDLVKEYDGNIGGERQ